MLKLLPTNDAGSAEGGVGVYAGGYASECGRSAAGGAIGVDGKVLLTSGVCVSGAGSGVADEAVRVCSETGADTGSDAEGRRETVCDGSGGTLALTTRCG